MPHGLISTVLGSFLSFASRSYSIGIGSEFFFFLPHDLISSVLAHSYNILGLPHDLISSVLAHSCTIPLICLTISFHRYWLRVILLFASRSYLPLLAKCCFSSPSRKKQTSKSSIPVAREQCKTPPQFHNNRHTFNGRHASKKVLCPDIYSYI